MDGRVQLPVINHLMTRFNVTWVDSITEAGPVQTLTGQNWSPTTDSVLRRLEISVNKHNSCAIALVAHHNCAGNPAPKDKQIEQLNASMKYVSQKYPNLPVIGLWLDENWSVSEIAKGD